MREARISKSPEDTWMENVYAAKLADDV